MTNEPQPDKDGWIEWAGIWPVDECPFDGSPVRPPAWVEITYRSGKTNKVYSSHCRWWWDPNYVDKYDIIRYRLLSPMNTSTKFTQTIEAAISKPLDKATSQDAEVALSLYRTMKHAPAMQIAEATKRMKGTMK